MPDRLAVAMQELYAADVDDFMAVRKRLAAAAKAEGDADAVAEIGRLRKPSVAAWALNLVARRQPSAVQRLLDLGTTMRAAQSRLDTATLTGLRPERDELLADLVAAAVDVALETGRRLSPAAQQDVRASAIAALADEQAARAVASGQLTRALSYSGFGEVDLAEAVARTSSTGSILTLLRGSGMSSAPEDSASLDDDTSSAPTPDLEALATAVEAAGRDLAAAESAVAEARDHADETRQRLEVVERQLGKAREADERALEAVTDAVRARKAAETARHAAQQALAQAQDDS